MEQTQHLLQNELKRSLNRRMQLLPWWVKIFIWIFLVLGTIAPLALVFASMGYKFQISLYGLETNEPLSLTGMFLLIVFFLKGIVAYSLWSERDWAVKIGIIDAILGLAICLFAIIYPFIFYKPNQIFNFRLEILILIPYLLFLLRIKDTWSSFSNIKS